MLVARPPMLFGAQEDPDHEGGEAAASIDQVGVAMALAGAG